MSINNIKSGMNGSDRPGEKKVHIEFLRIAAAFFVIVNHTATSFLVHLEPSPTWLCVAVYFFICKIAVPLFLFIMGALLLEKEDSPRKSAQRLLRIFTVFTAGSLIYYIYYGRRGGSFFSLLEFLLNLPRSQVTNAFWYLYLYLALLCMLPILQKLVKALSKGQMEYLLFLSLGVLGTAPLISIFFPSFQLSGYFTSGLIGVYTGQVLLGYYIERYVPMTRQVFWLSCCSFGLLIVFQVAGTYLLYLEDPFSYLALDNRTLITITASAACCYICVKYVFTNYPLCSRLSRGVRGLGSLTFGVYLLSDMVIEETYHSLYMPLRMLAHPFIALILWELAVFAISVLASVALRFMPSLRKWL